MGDLAFKYDQDKKFADIQIANGDFLLCDTDVDKVVISDYPGKIVVTDLSGGLESANGVYTYLDQYNGKPRWQIGLFRIEWVTVNTAWKIVKEDGNPDITFAESTTGDTTLPPTDSADYSTPSPTGPSLEYVYPSNAATRVSSLEVAVGLSLFTDRRASESEINEFQSGITDRQSRRGYWANTFRNIIQGSGLWLLSRSKRQEVTRSRAEAFALTSLQWLKDDGIAQDVEVQATLTGRTGLDIQVRVIKPSGEDLNFKYQFVWE